jgi:AraC-like DNA-binding protein
MTVLINPHSEQMGKTNAVLMGRSARYVSRFAGPLSVKGVLRGSATWQTAAGRFEVVAGSALLLNDGEEYEVVVDALQPVETFCFFFARGFVEDALRASTTSSAALLDTAPAAGRVAFAERIHFNEALLSHLTRAHDAIANEDHAAVEEAFFETALWLVRAHRDVDARAAHLPALRAATRTELARRVTIATAFLHANLDRRVAVEEAAREACLSPFHFQRLFAAFHGTTPHRYVTRLRLERARALLRDQNRRVADIALDCGFASLGSFTTLFTRTFGEAPARFRRNGEVGRGGARYDESHE